MIMMKQKTEFRSEHSLRVSPPFFPHHPLPPSVLTDWHPVSNFHTFLKWCDSHYYYKHRDTLTPNSLMFNISSSVMLHKQGKASILAFATRFKIALPSKFLNLLSLHHNRMSHHPHLYRKHFSIYKALTCILFHLILLMHLAGSYQCFHLGNKVSAGLEMFNKTQSLVTEQELVESQALVSKYN